MYQAPSPPLGSSDPKTSASRFAWVPVVAGVGGVLMGAASGGLAWIAAPVGLAIAGGSGWWLFGKHRRELAEHQEQRFEALALTAFRQHSGTTMTKEQLVRDHRLHPDEADAVLNWLVTHDLLTTDWNDYDGPLVFERSDAAAGLPIPEARPTPTRRSKGRGDSVVVHHHHAPPPPSVHGGYKNPGLAMALSFFWPGVGQMYSGNVGRGLAWMLGTWFGYAMLVIPGVIAHVMNVVNARQTAEEANRHFAQHGHLPSGQIRGTLPPPPPVYPPRRPPGL